MVSNDKTEFKLGDRVRTPDGDGEILSFQDGLIEVGIKGENNWFYDAEDIKSLSGTAPIVPEVLPLAPWEKELLWTPFEQNVRRITDQIADLLISKNKQYSNSALDPIRVFSKADRMEQLRVRADDKLSRIRNGDTSEDAVLDLCGYLILMKIAGESE